MLQPHSYGETFRFHCDILLHEHIIDISGGMSCGKDHRSEKCLAVSSPNTFGFRILDNKFGDT